MKSRGFLSLSVLAGPIVVFLSQGIVTFANRQDAMPAELPFSKYQLLGAGSCAAMPCHNGNGPKGARRSEYTTWIVHDKHARAYEVLFEKQSRRMLQILGNHSEREPVHPEKDRRCLNCHVYPGLDKVPHKAETIRQDGVSCEACHGPAEKWLTQHYTERWQGLGLAEKEERGMRDTKSVSGRAAVCVSCHVGQPGNDVNHDLIAAGHPPLKFEFGAYHANMPHHWNDARDKKPQSRGGNSGPDFEARAWAIGQLVTARAALKLLAYRAGHEQAPWPEFAEVDCFSCHHSLQEKSWRQARYLHKRPAGSYSWGSWYHSMPRALAAMDAKAGSKLSALEELDKEMCRPLPRRRQVAGMAAKAATELRQLLEAARQAPPSKVDDIIRKFTYLAQDDQHLANTNWDTAAQLYLGLAALSNAWKDLAADRPASLAPRLNAMSKTLRFPKGFQSPGPGFSPLDFQKELGSLRKLFPVQRGP